MADHADIGFRQKAVIEFLFNEGIAAKQISDRLKNIYKESALSHATVKQWLDHFKSGRTDINDKPRSGRPASAVTEVNKKRVDEMIRSDRRVTIRDIVDVIETGHNAVQNLISELGYTKVCARWVPRQLTDQLKQSRLDICKQMMQRCESEGDEFMNSIVTGDESWAHHYEPETKRQSMQWRHLGSPSPKKFKCVPSAGKVMVTVFWDAHGVLLVDFLPKGETINSSRYQDTLTKLARAIRRKRSNRHNVVLHHDNARPHTANATTEAISAKG